MLAVLPDALRIEGLEVTGGEMDQHEPGDTTDSQVLTTLSQFTRAGCRSSYLALLRCAETALTDVKVG